MKLPSFRRILKTDYSEEFQQLVDTLASSINIGIELLYTSLNKQISLRDNIQCDVKDVTITVNSSGVPISDISFNVTVSTVEGLVVISATNNTLASTFPSSGIFISFTKTGSAIKINHITGLQTDNSYTLRIIVFG